MVLFTAYLQMLLIVASAVTFSFAGHFKKCLMSRVRTWSSSSVEWNFRMWLSSKKQSRSRSKMVQSVEASTPLMHRYCMLNFWLLRIILQGEAANQPEADRVLRIDPDTDRVETIGDAFPGRWKWYGGILAEDNCTLSLVWIGVPWHPPIKV